MVRVILSRMRGAGRNVVSDDRGAMAILMAVGAVAFVGFAGLSVDAMRGYLVQSRLSSALDAAGLAGARVMYSPTRDADIQMFFESNFPTNYLGATVDGPHMTLDTNSEILTLTASATIDTTLMRILGFSDLTVSAATEITRETELLELVLAIDMSGSMAGSRITAARSAANELVNILFGDDPAKALLKIAVVPWNGKVNVTLNGTTFNSALNQTVAVPSYTNPFATSSTNIYYANNSPVPLLSPPPSNWKGCVFARYTHNDGSNDADLMDGPTSMPVSGRDWPAWQPIGPEGEQVPGFAVCSMSTNGADCGNCLTHGITPLNSTKANIQAAIDQLLSPTGSTNATQGLAWAWRVLTPGAPFNEAEADPEGRRTQAIVLLTDGQQTGDNGDGYKTVFGYNNAARAGGADQRLKDLADAIKGQGILIYAIQFGETSSALETLLKYVATGPDSPFYHKAPTSAELQQVFKEVANDLSSLRVSM